MATTFDDTTIKHSLYMWKVPFQCTERACVIFFRFRNLLQKMYYVTKSVPSFKDQREYKKTNNVACFNTKQAMSFIWSSEISGIR